MALAMSLDTVIQRWREVDLGLGPMEVNGGGVICPSCLPCRLFVLQAAIGASALFVRQVQTLFPPLALQSTSEFGSSSSELLPTGRHRFNPKEEKGEEKGTEEMNRKTTFKGANVFMSRKLVPPEIFDSLHDALKHNGADVYLCCDPSRNGPNDYHIISSHDHEKFSDLREKGCNLLGPQCVLSCAKEHRVLPKQGFTCCLAMDGVKVLASGFDMEEKVKIEKLVTAMGGALQAKASSDVSFVIVKNVLAAKYKWALNNLKKPIVTVSWLHQCWKEHRVVPHESYRVLPFSGLTISVTQIPIDERKEIEKLVIQNGGKYSAELTKKSTHLVCDAPEGDKYKVAGRWGHIHIVARTWFNQSVARRACLNEDSYPVQNNPATSTSTMKTSSKAQHSQDKVIQNLQFPLSSLVHTKVSGDAMADGDVEATLSQTMSTIISDVPGFITEDNGASNVQPKNSTDIDGCVAEDSQTEESDLYLMNCRIYLVGFDSLAMRRLVNMVRGGGGTRHMSLSEKLTHIIVGAPSEIEKKEVRSLSAMGVINVVRTVWLEDCDREKREVPVLRRHIAYDLLLPKDSMPLNKGTMMPMPGLKQAKPSTVQPILPNVQPLTYLNSSSVMSSEKKEEVKVTLNANSSLKTAVGCSNSNQSQLSDLNSLNKDQQKVHRGFSSENQDKKSCVFKGRLFRFSSSFPKEQRGEVVDWIHEGGGEVVDYQTKKIVHFMVESHGVVQGPTHVAGVTAVSTHWIRSCLEDGCLLDVSSHILFSPLQCKIPLPGFKGLRFCVSQYEEKDRMLLRNLCHMLGGSFTKKLTKRVNYLICKFTEGPKYEAASEWGIQAVNIEWITECVKQNKVVASDLFLPKEATISDREAGACTMSQYPTQAVRMISAVGGSQLNSQSQDQENIHSLLKDSSSGNIRNEAKQPDKSRKRSRLFEEDSMKGSLSSGVNQIDTICRTISTRNKVAESSREVSNSVPDVAAAIEDLLEQTSKIHEQNIPERTEPDKNVSEVFTSDCSMLGHDLHAEDPHSVFGLSKHWIKRSNETDDITNSSCKDKGIYSGFSETQTESQVVGYEEDLSGRQMIIDRVRTRSGSTPNPSLTLT